MLRVALEQTAGLFLAGCLVATFAIQSIRKFRQIEGVRSFAGIANRFAILSVYLAVALVSLEAYMKLFANSLYDEIPSALGGPGLEWVQLEIKKDQVPDVENIGIQFRPRISPPQLGPQRLHPQAPGLNYRELDNGGVDPAGSPFRCGSFTRLMT